ncbi:HSPB1-associated protein 1 [Anopheles nili]|uniref:HSPB1-associated protein 1 n=1 Tax=Anopheles nili TaxID=185578 RepID=UPI00237B99A0|nr:HSPB1-associated protein 1 [Anopheles nili]
MDPTELRDIILNARQPYVVHNAHLPWDCFRQTFEEWCEMYDGIQRELIPFEGCSVESGSTPQWECQRTKAKMRMSDLCKFNVNAKKRWNTFSYRNIHELPEACRRGINFACFGFPEVDNDITFWISSAQAHTPCHYDTYGCNIVVQVYGRKSWILLPPEAKLKTLRVPFEESSVYCEQNFYSPASFGSFAKVENHVYHIILEPGMALIVPPRWWHYVETLEPSLNFNTWLGVEDDVDAQISECITKLLIQDICNGETENVRKNIINPNEDLSMSAHGIEESFSILHYLMLQKQSNKRQCMDIKRYPFGYLSNDVFNALIKHNASFIKPIQHISPSAFFSIISRNSLRYNPEIDDKTNRTISNDEVEKLERLKKFINVCCNPELVNTIKTALLNGDFK